VFELWSVVGSLMVAVYCKCTDHSMCQWKNFQNQLIFEFCGKTWWLDFRITMHTIFLLSIRNLSHLAIQSGPRSCRCWNTSEAYFDTKVSSTLQLQFLPETTAIDVRRHCNTRPETNAVTDKINLPWCHKLTGSQLSRPHWTNRKLMSKKTKKQTNALEKCEKTIQ